MSDEEQKCSSYPARAILPEEKNYVRLVVSACMGYDCNNAKQAFMPYDRPNAYNTPKCTMCGGVMRELEVFIHKTPNLDYEVNTQIAIPLSQIGSLGFIEETRRGTMTGHNASGGSGMGGVLVIWDGVKDH